MPPSPVVTHHSPLVAPWSRSPESLEWELFPPQARSALVPVIYWLFGFYQCSHFVTAAEGSEEPNVQLGVSRLDMKL